MVNILWYIICTHVDIDNTLFFKSELVLPMLYTLTGRWPVSLNGESKILFMSLKFLLQHFTMAVQY